MITTAIAIAVRIAVAAASSLGTLFLVRRLVGMPFAGDGLYHRVEHDLGMQDDDMPQHQVVQLAGAV